MDTTVITIEEAGVTIRPAASGIWLTQHQIADLFGVVISAVNNNIRAILKSEVLREDEVCCHQESENGGLMTLYNMEMITALAFRLKSRPAEWFRQWIVRKMTNNHPLVIWKIPGIETMLN